MVRTAEMEGAGGRGLTDKYLALQARAVRESCTGISLYKLTSEVSQVRTYDMYRYVRMICPGTNVLV